MKNAVLNKIKEDIVKELNKKYGFCGLADGDDAAMINSSDSEGNDIIINISVRKE